MIGTLIKIAAGYTFAKFGFDNIISYTAKLILLNHNNKQLEKCRVVDIMGDTLYYDFRIVKLA